MHGIYRPIPEGAETVQTNAAGEVIAWQTGRYGGTLFASTLDPVDEHCIQQIRMPGRLQILQAEPPPALDVDADCGAGDLRAADLDRRLLGSRLGR